MHPFHAGGATCWPFSRSPIAAYGPRRQHAGLGAAFSFKVESEAHLLEAKAQLEANGIKVLV